MLVKDARKQRTCQGFQGLRVIGNHTILSCVSLLANVLASLPEKNPAEPIQARAFGGAGRCRKDSVQRGNRTSRTGPIRTVKGSPSLLLPRSNVEGRKKRFDGQYLRQNHPS